MKTATTIFEQIGGNRFRAMTGAKDFVGGENYLMFGLPSRLTKSGINKVKITLGPSDTYTVEYMKINFRKCEVKTVAKDELVYATDLARVFTIATGLDTRI